MGLLRASEAHETKLRSTYPLRKQKKKSCVEQIGGRQERFLFLQIVE
jgi:hypothetical protein